MDKHYSIFSVWILFNCLRAKDLIYIQCFSCFCLQPFSILLHNILNSNKTTTYIFFFIVCGFGFTLVYLTGLCRPEIDRKLPNINPLEKSNVGNGIYVEKFQKFQSPRITMFINCDIAFTCKYNIKFYLCIVSTSFFSSNTFFFHWYGKLEL